MATKLSKTKRFFLVFLVLLLVSHFAVFQFVPIVKASSEAIPVNYDGQIYQMNGDYTKDDTGSLMDVGGVYQEIVPGWGSWYRYRDYLRFSLADLPAGLTVAQITQVRLYLYCYVAGQDTYHLLDVHAYNTNGQTDPSADTGATLYNRCASGNLYFDDSPALRTGGDKWFVLGGNIKQDILDAKAAVNRIALALHEEGDDEAYAELHTLEFPSGYKALLEITWTEEEGEEYSYTFTETLSPSASLNQWQEQSYIMTQTLIFTSTLEWGAEWSSIFIETISMTETITYYQEHIRIIEETVQPSATLTYLQEQHRIFSQTIASTETITYWQEQVYSQIETLTVTETSEHKGEGIFVLSQTITPSETMIYWQEQIYVLTQTLNPSETLTFWQEQFYTLTETLALTVAFEYSMEGIQVFFETFTETLNPTATMQYWIETAYIFSESLNLLDILQPIGAEAIYILTETLDQTATLNYALEIQQILFETLHQTVILNYAMELAEAFITNMETLTPHGMMYYEITSVIEISIPSARFFIISVAVALASLALILKMRQQVGED